MRRATLTALVLLTAFVPQASADPATDTLIAQSCAALTVSTVGTPDVYAAQQPGAFPEAWPEPATGAALPAEVPLRTETTTYNRLYEFATTAGTIYGRVRSSGEPWRELPLPLCFAGRVDSISVDDDELVAIDNTGRIFTMDNALKDPASFHWTSRWGPPVWTGLGFSIPTDLRAWSWSVISPVEDHNWIDPAGNRTAIGEGKVSHIWGLDRDRRRLHFWDPWLPLDSSYEMCGPERGRFKSVGLSASGSYVFVIGRRGDLFTRFYDFDIAGHNSVFFNYSYDDQRGAGPGAPIQLPGARWVEQPKIDGRITSTISIAKTGIDAVHRILRVEGVRDGQTGYWERDVADPPAAGWTFHPTNLPLTGKPLANPRADTSRRGLARGEDRRYVMRADGVRATLRNFNVYCSPARLVVREGASVSRSLLYTVDALRQAPRARGLDNQPREQYAAIRHPDGSFQEVTVNATASEIVIEDLGWTFQARPKRRR